MSEFTIEKIRRIAKLARIRIDKNEVERYSNQLTSILNEIEKLQEVNTKGIEPLVNVTEQPLLMHDDAISDGEKAEEVLSNATDSKYNCYVVPKVIE